MQTAKRVAMNTGILYGRMIITVFVSLYATRLILNALGASDFGIFNVVGGAIALLAFLNNAMTTATQRFMAVVLGSGETHKLKTIFNVSLVLHFAIGIVIVMLLQAASMFLFDGILQIPIDRIPVAKLIFQFLIISTFFTIVSVPYDAVLNAHENMLFLAILRIIETALKLIIAIYITYTIYDQLIAYGVLMASLAILLLIIRQIYCHRKYDECDIKVIKKFDKTEFIGMAKFAGWSFLGSSSSVISNYGQGIVLNMFFGTIVNAAQGIANQVSGQLGALSNTMLKALNPVIVKSEGAGNRALMIKATLTGSKLSFFLLVFLYVPVLIEMPYIFTLWLKEVPNYAIIFCKLLLIRNLTEQLFVPLVTSIGAVGKIKNFQIYSSILTILTLPVSYILFKLNYQPFYLYIVFIIYSLITGYLILLFSNKIYGLSYSDFLKSVLFRCITSFIMIYGISSIPAIFMEEGIGRLVTVLSISLICFIVFVWIIGLNKEEKMRAGQLIKSTLVKINNVTKRLSPLTNTNFK